MRWVYNYFQSTDDGKVYMANNGICLQAAGPRGEAFHHKDTHAALNSQEKI